MELVVVLTPFGRQILACARLGDAVVGCADYDRDDASFANVWTHPQARMRGVATAIYDAFEARDLRVVPSETLTEDGMAFWRRRGVDPARFGSRLIVGGRGVDAEVFGKVDVTAEVEAWDEARAEANPRP